MQAVIGRETGPSARVRGTRVRLWIGGHPRDPLLGEEVLDLGREP